MLSYGNLFAIEVPTPASVIFEGASQFSFLNYLRDIRLTTQNIRVTTQDIRVTTRDIRVKDFDV